MKEMNKEMESNIQDYSTTVGSNCKLLTGDTTSTFDLWPVPWDWLTAELPSVAESWAAQTGVRQQVNESNAWQSQWSTTETTSGKQQRGSRNTHQKIYVDRTNQGAINAVGHFHHYIFHFHFLDWCHNFQRDIGFKDSFVNHSCSNVDSNKHTRCWLQLIVRWVLVSAPEEFNRLISTSSPWQLRLICFCLGSKNSCMSCWHIMPSCEHDVVEITLKLKQRLIN